MVDCLLIITCMHSFSEKEGVPAHRADRQNIPKYPTHGGSLSVISDLHPLVDGVLPSRIDFHEQIRSCHVFFRGLSTDGVVHLKKEQEHHTGIVGR